MVGVRDMEERQAGRWTSDWCWKRSVGGVGGELEEGQTLSGRKEVFRADRSGVRRPSGREAKQNETAPPPATGFGQLGP